MGSEEIGSVMGTSEHSISDNVAEMSICSESILFKPPGGVDPFYGSSGWDPVVVSGDQAGNFLGNESAMVHQHYLENQTVGGSPFASDFLSFRSGSFSGMVTHQEILHCRKNSEDGVFGALLNGKRKRKDVEVEEEKNQNGETSEFPKEEEEKEEEEKKCISANPRSKRGSKQAKSNSKNGAEPSKEDYILLRAKRGQATNSHSLAERVRREKISERMKLLQELVPGCNKITGKAVMLDEIINYVQSLQQQVEFLSMKLATVNPEVDVDIERLLSKDLLHQQGGNGIGRGLSSSHAFPGLPLGTIIGFPGPAPPFHPLPQNLWNNELQSILQMGFDSLNNSGPNGCFDHFFPGLSSCRVRKKL
ncbi:hypothetical protein OROHE_020580 [Orobanche hederae]